MKRFPAVFVGVFSFVTVFLHAPIRMVEGKEEAKVDYVRDVKPILARHCYSCHGVQKQKSGLRLDTAAAAQLGGNSGPAIVPGNSGESRLIKAVTGSDNSLPRMPFKKAPLKDREIAVLKAWIDQGAKAPGDERPQSAATEASSHWAFQSLSRPKIPDVKNSAWVRNPIDRFVLARLEKEGIAPSPEADRVTLIRRLKLDLLGLPPSLAEVDAFLADTRADAYERRVDRFLHSPHYGERWGRHWLDLARYADSNGFNIDAPRSIWSYRNWVIQALNSDLPFDQFAIEQIAGDLLPQATLPQKIATGFHRNTLINEEGGIDLEQFRVESIVDRVNTTGSVFLGLTIGCAQCHDHKFDPISQREYYQLFAFFNNSDEPTLELPTPEQERLRNQIRSRIAGLNESLRGVDFTSDAKRLEWERSLTAAARANLSPVVNNILDIPEHQRDAQQLQTIRAAYRFGDQARNIIGGLGQPLPFLAAGHLQTAVFRFSVEKQVAELKKSEPAVVTTMVLEEHKEQRPTHVHLGGDFLRKGARVAPEVPSVLPPLKAYGSQPVSLNAFNRLDLARWLVDAKNPLTPRVTMNRFWQRYFGLGLVETDNDFGSQGARPTYPELLDWLAAEFIAQNWSMKAMHRLIVTSATYRQSSHHRPELATIDPRNQLLARQSRMRLEAEIVRDVALAASGLLSQKIGGPSVFPPQPEGVFRLTQIQREWKANDGPDRYRRGMYTHFWRSAPHPALTVFDAPEATTTCTRRNRSNTPLQALTLLNDQAFFEFARGLAARILANGGPQTDSERVQYAFRLCLARSPSDFEQNRLEALLAQQSADFQTKGGDAQLKAPADIPPGTKAMELDAWTTVARVLLNLDEFITRE